MSRFGPEICSTFDDLHKKINFDKIPDTLCDNAIFAVRNLEIEPVTFATNIVVLHA
jgi:hypothetical protein